MPTEELKVIVQGASKDGQPVRLHKEEKITTVSELNQHQADAFVLEKAVKVTRITIKQELQQQLKNATAKVNTLSKNINVIEPLLRRAVVDRALAEIRKSKRYDELAKALIPVFGKKFTAANLVLGVQLILFSTAEGRSFRHYFDKPGNRASVKIILAVKAYHVATAKEWDDSEGEDQIQQGDAYYVGNNSNLEWVSLSPEEKKELKEWDRLSAEYKQASALVKELEERLKNVGDAAEAVEAQVLRAQIGSTKGGEEILTLMDKNMKAAAHGNFLSLLGPA